MARILTCGWETGLIGEDSGSGANSGGSPPTLVTSTPSPRSGAYSLKCVPGNSNNQYSRRTITLPGFYTEHYGRAPFFPHSSLIDILGTVVELYDSIGTLHLTLKVNMRTGILTLYRAASTLIATSSAAVLWDAWNAFEYKCKINDADGIFQLWLNNELVIDFSGNTRNAGNAEIKTIVLGLGWGVGSSSNCYIAFDDLAINDTTGITQSGRCGDAAVLFLPASGNGNSSQLVGSDADSVDNYALVDDVPPNTADYVASNTPDAQDTYTIEAIPAPYNAVTLVQPISYAALAAAGEGALRNVLRSGGTDYPDAADKPLTPSYAFVKGDVYYVDPADGAAWTIAKANALQPGPRVR
jgi:hypothetical protein